MSKLYKLGYYSILGGGLTYGGLLWNGKADEINFLFRGLIRGMRCGIAGASVAKKYLKVISLKALKY